MPYQLSQTPTLEAVASGDEKLLAQDLQARVEEAVKLAESAPEVVEAMGAQAAAVERLSHLRAAERELNRQSKEARERAAALGLTVLDALVEAAGVVEPKKVAQLAAAEDQIRFMGRAIERLTEHQIPMAEIGSMQEEAHSLLAQSRALERVAQERAERVLGQIREAVSEEMVLPVDMSKGVTGALLARAAALKSRAVRISQQSDELGRAYQERYEA